MLQTTHKTEYDALHAAAWYWHEDTELIRHSLLYEVKPTLMFPAVHSFYTFVTTAVAISM